MGCCGICDPSREISLSLAQIESLDSFFLDGGKLAKSSPEGFQVPDDGSCVYPLQSVTRHGRLRRGSAHAASGFKKVYRIGFDPSWQTRDIWSLKCPFLISEGGVDRYGRSLKQFRTLQLAASVSRSVALDAHGYLLDEVPATFDLPVGWLGRRDGRQCKYQ